MSNVVEAEHVLINHGYNQTLIGQGVTEDSDSQCDPVDSNNNGDLEDIGGGFYIDEDCGWCANHYLGNSINYFTIKLSYSNYIILTKCCCQQFII
jgi:hypothetical protein